MRIRDLIDELIVLETQNTPDTLVAVEVETFDHSDEPFICEIAGTGHTDGQPVLRVTPSAPAGNQEGGHA